MGKLLVFAKSVTLSRDDRARYLKDPALFELGPVERDSYVNSPRSASMAMTALVVVIALIALSLGVTQIFRNPAAEERLRSLKPTRAHIMRVGSF